LRVSAQKGACTHTHTRAHARTRNALRFGYRAVANTIRSSTMSLTKPSSKPVVKRRRRIKPSCLPGGDRKPPKRAVRFIRALGERAEPMFELALQFGVPRHIVVQWSRNPMFRTAVQVALRYSPFRRGREVEIFSLALRTRPLYRVCRSGYEPWLVDDVEFLDESDPWHPFPHMPPDLPAMPSREFVD
jgi:hypothetical protein